MIFFFSFLPGKYKPDTPFLKINIHKFSIYQSLRKKNFLGITYVRQYVCLYVFMYVCLFVRVITATPFNLELSNLLQKVRQVNS